MCLSPLSGDHEASFPQVLESSISPAVPNPILESQPVQWSSSLLMIPILALEKPLFVPTALKPSLLQLSSAMRPENQSASSTCYGPVKWSGIAHQRSVSTESLPACWWQWSWSVGRSSFQDRSWKRMCSSRSVTWSLVHQTQSLLHEGCIHPYYSSTQSYIERCSKTKRQKRSVHLKYEVSFSYMKNDTIKSSNFGILTEYCWWLQEHKMLM